MVESPLWIKNMTLWLKKKETNELKFCLDGKVQEFLAEREREG